MRNIGYLWVIIKFFYTRKMARTTLTWMSNSEKKIVKGILQDYIPH